MPEVLFTPLCVDMLESGHPVRFQASGTSMHPAIRDREWVTVEPVAPEFLSRGDVVLYRSRRGLTAHRLRRVEARGIAGRSFFVIAADNVADAKEHIEAGEILGRVASVERRGRVIDPGALRARIGASIWRLLAACKRGLAERLPEATRKRCNELRRRSAVGQGGMS
jgi:hypothetical protein